MGMGLNETVRALAEGGRAEFGVLQELSLFKSCRRKCHFKRILLHRATTNGCKKVILLFQVE